MSNELLTDASGGILTLTLNRPEAKNALNKAVSQQISDALLRLDEDDDLKVAIITGAGGGFSSGMDLKAFLTGELPYIEGRGFAGIAEAEVKKPVIAAVEGFALAGGFELMVCCDLIVAARDAKLGIPEVKRGLVAIGGGLLRMPRQLPHRIAMEMSLTGNSISAQHAADLGLVNRLCEPGSALAEATNLAQQITENGPLAVQVSKQILNQSVDWQRDEMFAKQLEIAKPVFTSNDAKEGPRAFAEKRKPRWTGT